MEVKCPEVHPFEHVERQWVQIFYMSRKRNERVTPLLVSLGVEVERWDDALHSSCNYSAWAHTGQRLCDSGPETLHSIYIGFYERFSFSPRRNRARRGTESVAGAVHGQLLRLSPQVPLPRCVNVICGNIWLLFWEEPPTAHSSVTSESFSLESKEKKF
jgi:hypothetical protein